MSTNKNEQIKRTFAEERDFARKQTPSQTPEKKMSAAIPHKLMMLYSKADAHIFPPSF